MSLHSKRVCPICQAKFDPIVDWQVCDTERCAAVLRMRRFRARKRCGGGDDGGGGGQRRLFPMLVKSKRPKPAKRVHVPEPTLFPDDAGGLLATLGGPIEYEADGSVSDKQHSRYSVKSDRPKPPTRVEQPFAGEPHAA